MLECDNPFWSFSLAVYGAPGVSAECIALQDTLGTDVNVLLFSAWFGAAKRRALTGKDFTAIEAAMRPWRDTVIVPLRAVRRGIKTLPDAADDTIAVLRRDVAALELRGEQIAQAMLYRLVPAFGASSAATAEEAARRNVSALLTHDGAAASKATSPLLVEAALSHASQQ